MAISLTSEYKIIRQETIFTERWQEGWASATQFQCRHTLSAKYVSRSNSSATIRVKIKFDQLIDPPFVGIWCNPNYGGYFSFGCYNDSSHANAWNWVRREDWTAHNDYSWYYEQDFTVSCNYGAWSGSVGHYGVYSWCNMNEGNSKLTGAVQLDSLVTSPSEPSVSIVSKSTNGATFNVSVSSMGNPSSESGRYIEAGISQTNGYFPGDTLRRISSAVGQNSATIIVSNNISNLGTLNIVSNARYYYGGYADNTQAHISTIVGQFWTLPESPTASNFQALTTTTASFSIAETSVGTGRTVQLRYRYKTSSSANYGEWINAGSPGNNHTVSVSLSNLSPGANYDIQVSSLAGGDESSVTTYLSAFQTVGCQGEITGYEFSSLISDQGEVCVPTTFNCAMSGAVSASDTYTLTITCTSGSIVKTATTTATGDLLTKNIVVNLLSSSNSSISYSVVLNITLNSSSYTYTLQNGVTIPQNRPESPTIDYQYNSTNRQIAFYATPSALGQIQTFSSLVFNAYKVDTNSNETLIQTYTSTTNARSGFNIDKSAIDPILYPHIKLSVVQNNTVGVSSIASVENVTNKNKIIGKLILQSGTKSNIVRIRVKKSDGTLTSGNYEHPFTLIENS